MADNIIEHNTIANCPYCNKVLTPNIIRVVMGWGMQYCCVNCGYITPTPKITTSTNTNYKEK